MPPTESEQPDYSGSCMLALYPPADVAKKLAIPGGLDPDDLHLTVVYTGDSADVDRASLRKVAKRLADRPPLAGKITGHARFTGGDKDVIVALVDSTAVEKLHQDALGELDKAGIDAPSEHSYIQHITLAYVGPGDPSPVERVTSKPVKFAAVTASHGDDRKHHQFDTSLEEAARQAYAAGWALSGGPMTDRVRAGCTAAVQTALEHYDHPAVLEATLQIGKLEGTWATFFDRREKLTNQQVKLIIAILAAILAGLPIVKLVDRLRAEASAGVYTADYLKTLTTQAAGGLLAGIYAHDSHGDLTSAVEDALRAAMAEGQAGALALNADKHGIADFSFDQAYKAIYDRLVHLPDLPLMAQDWVQRMISGASRDIGSLLARLLEEDATSAEMIRELTAALDVADAGSITNRAVTAFLNQSMSQAMSQASLNLYASEGAAQAYYVTAGDGRVCVICQSYEDGNPYAVADCPTPGVHPFCRCVVTVQDPAPFQALAALIG